jgi:hypothetical protein
MTAEATKVCGGCLCGRIRYDAEVYLHDGYICHCTICQKSTGQPAEITVLIKPGSLRYRGNAPKYFQSSPGGKRGFCPDCGSRIVWQAIASEDDWMTNLCVGSLDNPADARVTSHIYADTQLPWYDPCADLPKFTAADEDEMMAFIRP